MNGGINMDLSQLIIPCFTGDLSNTNKSVYDLFEWKDVEVKMTDYATGKTIVHMEHLSFPTHFSQSACDIIASKYFRKSGVPNQRGMETSFKEVVHRMTNFWVTAAVDEGLFDASYQDIVYNELAYMMLAQMWAPNSPQWFNTGIQNAYHIPGSPQGHYYYAANRSVISSICVIL